MIAFAFIFPAGRYHATPWGRHANEADVAWPPEPVRILRALIATWWRKGDHVRFPKSFLDDLIDALAAEPPLFHLPDAVHTHVRAFMPAPTNKTLIYDAFLRFSQNAKLVVSWPAVTLTPEQEILAAHLLERIGYLGRAESWTEGRIATVSDLKENNAAPRSSCFSLSDTVPVDILIPLSSTEWHDRRTEFINNLYADKIQKKVPLKGKDALIAATLPERLCDALAVDTSQWQEAGWSSPPPLRTIVYDRPVVGPLPTHRSRKIPLSKDLNIPQVARFVLAGRPRPRIEETLKIAEIARLALMSGRDTQSKPPLELLGRDENGPLRGEPAHAHAFFLPEDADNDGLIDHLIVYCRTGFSDEARRRLDRLTRLWLSHGRANEEGERGRKEWRVALEDIAEPETFSSSRLLGNARVWVSVTPYLKNRFDKRRPADSDALIDTYRNQLAFEWKQRFPNIPPPTMEPLTDADGALRSTRAFTRTRAGRGGRQPDTSGGFFRLTFEQEVEGPIALGWGAHFGLGLFRRDELNPSLTNALLPKT